MQPMVMLSDEELWWDLLNKPDMWYDKRPTVNQRPDFVHKQHHFSLWLDSKWTPDWAAKGVEDADDSVRAAWAKVCLWQAVAVAA